MENMDVENRVVFAEQSKVSSLLLLITFKFSYSHYEYFFYGLVFWNRGKHIQGYFLFQGFFENVEDFPPCQILT